MFLHPRQNGFNGMNITGTLGGTAWVIMVNILVYHILKLAISKAEKPLLILNRSLIDNILDLYPMTISFIMYTIQYEEKEDPIEVVVVQPNTDPYNEQYDLNPLFYWIKTFHWPNKK